jgi:dTDP-4-amino-4,6-dideoxygalactose transaminase
MVGGFGNAEVFSFHATKFFNTLEGGAIVTNDDVLATRLRLMRNFGFAGEDNVISEGSNGKMNEVCAAMGLVNLDIIDDVVEINERNYRRYETGLVGIRGLSLFQVDSSEQSNYQYVVLLVDDAAGVPRDDILATLRANNVLARRYFWPSAHRMEPYRTLNPDAGVDLPITEWVSDRVIVLPTGTAVDETSIDKIIHLIRRTVEGN